MAESCKDLSKEQKIVCKSILCCNFAFHRYHMREIGFAVASIIVTLLRFPSYLQIFQFMVTLMCTLSALFLTFLHFKDNVIRKMFIETLLSFKGLIIFVNVILVVIIDIIDLIVYHELDSFDGPIYICEDIIWISYALIILSFDASKKMSRFLRFFGPVLISINLLYNIYKRTFVTPNVIFFSLNGHEISTNQLQITFYMEILTFIFTLGISPITDPNHEICVFQTNKIIRAHYLPWLVNYFYSASPSSLVSVFSQASINALDEPLIQKSDSEIELQNIEENKEDSSTTNFKLVQPQRTESFSSLGLMHVKFGTASTIKVKHRIPSGMLFSAYTIWGVTLIMMFVVMGCDKVWEKILLSVLTFTAMILTGYLIIKYFSIPLTLLSLPKQFHLSLFVLSVFIIFTTNILQMILAKTTESGLSRICLFCFNMVYCTSVLLCIARDGIIYPRWFSWFLLLSVLGINTYNFIYLEFLSEPISDSSYEAYLKVNPISQNPLFRKSQRYAYSQILLITVYLVWSLCTDKDHRYFGLIFDSKVRGL